ncbi:MAG: hypothetical protein KDC28_12495 [Saprospiraceae bacterium]|nr:hypothetical protein [Saprospiraceae bacterium]MCB9317638.1 hypothetical protein [Lewinellaceae bacterium]
MKNQHVQDIAGPGYARKLTGVLNPVNNPPEAFLLTGSRAPKRITAGKPTVTSNPNADGLGDPDFTIYNTLDGLGLDFVQNALLDKKGNLWFSTQGAGCSRYDGNKFTTYAAVNGLDNGVYSMVEDTAGNIWTSSGNSGNVNILYKYNGSKFISSAFPDNGNITMYADHVGNMWVGTDSGVYKCKYGNQDSLSIIVHLTTADGLADDQVNCILEDRKGNIWLGTMGGLSKYIGSEFINYSEKQGLLNNRINCLTEDLDGNIWIGSDIGISKLTESGITNYTVENGLVDDQINVIAADSYGAIWIGTGNGLSKCVQQENDYTPLFTNYTHANGLAVDAITTLTEDPSGNMWIGTRNGGVCKYNRNFLTKYSKSLGLGGRQIMAVNQDKDGHYWIGTIGGGVFKYDGHHFFNYNTRQGLASGDVFSILLDHDGNLWFGCLGSISKFDGKTFTNYTSDQGLPEWSGILNSIQDKQGNLWFTTWNGTYKFDGNSFRHFSTGQGLVTNQTVSVIQDQNGNMWFGGEGLSKWNPKTVLNYSAASGMPCPEMPSLCEDASGNIWTGTYGKGLCRINNDSITVYTTTMGLGDNTIYSLRRDTIKHRIWMGTNSGLVMMNENDPGKNTGQIQFENFNPSTGFDIKDFAFKFSLFVDKGGVIWGGTGDGKLIRFDYEKLNPARNDYLVQLQNIAVDNDDICWNFLANARGLDIGADSLAIQNEMVTTFGKVLSGEESQQMLDKYHKLQFDGISSFYPIPQHLILPYNRNNLRIDFAAIEPGFAGRMKYQYKLQGYDDAWSPLSDRTSASFGHISEGTYTFIVQAVNPAGVWSETSYAFTVLPPWYRAWWSYLIYLIAFLTLLWTFIEWRISALRKEKASLEEKVERRTHELREEKEKVENALAELKTAQVQLIQSEKMASMGELTAGIAHEIQNPLNFVNNFSEVNKEMIDELLEERTKEKGERNENLENEILQDIRENELKINLHGKRADSIVKSMLQHSRTSSGEKELTDINALCDEYVRLAYHGMRARDKSFSAEYRLDLDPDLSKIRVVPQDFGRVLLNIINNGFQACTERSLRATSDEALAKGDTNYHPEVTISTKQLGEHIEIRIADNGSGIPDQIKSKIFQPFFTTKPTGQGTGLGLSLSYDIIQAHGGEIEVESEKEQGTSFIVRLPVI